MFDLGAMAMIFSGALLLAPDRATLPYHEALAAPGTGRPGGRYCSGHFRRHRARFGRAVARLAEKGLGSILADARSFGGGQDYAFRTVLDSLATAG